MLALLLSIPLLGGSVWAGAYYNSSETGCDGTDATVLVCEDFETNGTATVNGHGKWYAKDCDTANASGGLAQVKGWCPTIYANPITPDGAELCGTGITPFGSCVGNGGLHSGVQGNVNMASHNFKTSGCGVTGAEVCQVNEIYVRWYAYWVAGYSWSGEKHMNLTGADGDIAFFNIQLNCGTGSRSSTADVSLQVLYGSITGTGISGGCNTVSGLTLSSGHWYFFEAHLIVGSSAVAEFWANDCGTDGLTGCVSGTNTPTKLVTASGNLPGNGVRSQVGQIWLENWSNNGAGGTLAGSVGTGPYWDQIKVTTTGPIGFASTSGGGGGGSPAAPTDLLLYIGSLAGAVHLTGFVGFLWMRRSEAVRASLKVWQYVMETPREMFWVYRYKRAVKKWQARAPIMLPEPMLVLHPAKTIAREKTL